MDLSVTEDGGFGGLVVGGGGLEFSLLFGGLIGIGISLTGT
jgi:hypothetical protein